MLRVNRENFNKWLAAMRNPASKQARSALCVINEDGDRTYCCLGLGSNLVPGMEIEERPFTESLTFNGMTNLAPYAFVEWLGLDVAAEFEDASDESLRSREYDLTPDWPDGLRMQGTRANADAGYRPASFSDLSAAGMNDDGFTFNQIADVFERFGIGTIIS